MKINSKKLKSVLKDNHNELYTNLIYEGVKRFLNGEATRKAKDFLLDNEILVEKEKEEEK